MSRKVLIMLGMLCLLSTAKAKADDVAYASCPSGEGYVFLYDTVTGFQVLANLKCGEQLTVVDTSDKDRARVRTASGKEGFVFKYTISTVPFGTQPQAAAEPPNVADQQPEPHPEPQPEPKPQGQPEPRPLPQPRAESRAALPVVRHRAELELFGGYSYMRANIVFSGAPLNANGASASVVMYLSNWFGISAISDCFSSAM